MLQFQISDVNILVFNDQGFISGSVDNAENYQACYESPDLGRYEPSSKHGIRIFRNGIELMSCILLGSGGATGIFGDSAIANEDRLLVCCGNRLFCLSIPELQLMWQCEADPVTCFSVFSLENDFVVHGEMQISRIGRNGNLIWQFSGADIFVSLEHNNFQLFSDHIWAQDFSGNQYDIDFKGHPL